MKNKDWRPTAFAETTPGVVTEEEADADHVDQRRAGHELLRHLMMLDSGALLLTVTLIAKVFAQPVHRPAVGVAVAAFLLSLIGGGITYLNLLATPSRVGSPRLSSSDRLIYVGSMAASFFGFVVGMGALAWFFCINWFR